MAYSRRECGSCCWSRAAVSKAAPTPQHTRQREAEAGRRMHPDEPAFRAELPSASAGSGVTRGARSYGIRRMGHSLSRLSSGYGGGYCAVAHGTGQIPNASPTPAGHQWHVWRRVQPPPPPKRNSRWHHQEKRRLSGIARWRSDRDDVIGRRPGCVVHPIYPVLLLLLVDSTRVGSHTAQP